MILGFAEFAGAWFVAAMTFLLVRFGFGDAPVQARPRHGSYLVVGPNSRKIDGVFGVR